MKTRLFPAFFLLVCLPCVLSTTDTQAQSTDSVLYTFQGGADGAGPTGALVMDGHGNLYGATSRGGFSSCANGSACGTVYELMPTSARGWTKKILYKFTGGSDGNTPYGLTLGTNGTLYGTASLGGSNECTYVLGCGTVFQLSPNEDGSWTESTLYRFKGGSDGQNPESTLMLDAQGDLYGTTVYGGGGACIGQVGCGTVFKLTHTADAWTETVLHAFSFNGTEGRYAVGGVILDIAGNIYGVTERGGTAGGGTIFKLSHGNDGWVEDVIYSFNGASGEWPESGLTQDEEGIMYGTTSEVGDQAACPVSPEIVGCGTVFELDNGGVFSVLYAFKGGEDGLLPLSTVTVYGGDLYGTTEQGSGDGCNDSLGCGTVFRLHQGIDGTWTEKILHGFGGEPDGEMPGGGVIFDPNGNLYGGTFAGGDGPFGGSGVVYVINSPSTIDFGHGFSGANGPMQFNGSTTLDGSQLLLTTGVQNQAGSAFYATPINVQSFTSDFTFQLSNAVADGFTFTIQNAGPGALGGKGAGLGFVTIQNSLAIKFDLYNNSGEGPDSTGLYIWGNLPTVPAINLSGTGINLHSGDSMSVHLAYNDGYSGDELTMKITDQKTGATWSNSFAIDIPATVGGNTAYVGFTGATGGGTATQAITSWTYETGSTAP